MSKRLSYYVGIILITIVIIAVYAQTIWSASVGAGYLRVFILDVGQGDAIFIQTPSGNQILVDGGPAPTSGQAAISKSLAEVMPFDDRTIDVLIATHPHADHIQGLIHVLNTYSVDSVIESDLSYDSATYRAWEDSIKNARHRVVARQGQVIDLGDGATIELIYPPATAGKSKKPGAHERMVVARLNYHNFHMLLTGDLDTKDEKFLPREKIAAQFLKVAHHGSRYSTSKTFIQDVSPWIGFISAAHRNRYGHPHADLLNRLDESNVKYYRTDINGAVTIESDGFYYRIATAR